METFDQGAVETDIFTRADRITYTVGGEAGISWYDPAAICGPKT
jgi:hypothetical protein